tara:strand:- start:2990 stop:3286 length:297 start_codon:yes stop_codon:yes gene_type:complete
MTEFQISYAVSYNEMVEKWIEDFHSIDHCLVIYDPLNHIKFLNDKQISIDDMSMYSSKVLIVTVLSINELLKIHESLVCDEGPYVQAWSHGALIRESY